jgi:hypothetical protein
LAPVAGDGGEVVDGAAQQAGEGGPVGGAPAGGRRPNDPAPERVDPVQHLAAGRGQDERRAAAVAGVGAALDQPGGERLRGEAAGPGLVDAERAGQLGDDRRVVGASTASRNS